MAREYDLYKNLGDIDICGVFDMCKGRSTYHFCRHGGVAATQGWTLESKEFKQALHLRR